MNVEYVEDAEIQIFKLEIRDAHGPVFIADICEVVGWEDDGKTAAEFEPYGSCFIKWDGCAHWSFPEQLHFCGVLDHKRHVIMIERVYKIAFRIMGADVDMEQRW